MFGRRAAMGAAGGWLWLKCHVEMRLRNCAIGGGLSVLVLIVAGVMWSDFRARSIGLAVGVHSYHRQGDGLSASLVLTNTGAVSVTVPLRFECQVEKDSGFTNYLVNTRYSIVLQPRQHMILSIAPMRVWLPEDTSAWQVNVRIRHQTARERFIYALHKTHLVDPRMVSRLAGRPRKEADYRWVECGSGLLEIPGTPFERPELQEK
jgi:hypothetical protein